jgi:hypothetical protein
MYSPQHKIKADASRLKMKKIKRYAVEKKICLQYSFGDILNLVALVISMLGLVL